jgi:hypothetical protein
MDARGGGRGSRAMELRSPARYGAQPPHAEREAEVNGHRRHGAGGRGGAHPLLAHCAAATAPVALTQAPAGVPAWRSHGRILPMDARQRQRCVGEREERILEASRSRARRRLAGAERAPAGGRRASRGGGVAQDKVATKTWTPKCVGNHARTFLHKYLHIT